MSNCLDTLVGLSQTVPNCFTDTAPVGYDVSDSGYYLNDPDFGFQVLDKCNFAGWSLFSSGLQSGLLNFKTDLRGSIYVKNDKKGIGFTGVIGKVNPKGVQHISASKTLIGHLMRIKENYRGMSLKLKKLYLGLDTAGDYTLSITSNDPDFVPITQELSCNGESFSANTLTDPIVLPMYSRFELESEYCGGLEYYFTISHGSARPLYTQFWCCGNAPAWTHWMNIHGMSCTEETIGENGSLSEYTTGLAYDAFMDCDDIGWVCNLSEMRGYDALDVCARAIQYRSSAIIIDKFLSQGIVNLCTLYNKADLRSHQTFLNKKYGEYMAYIVENIPTGISDCFTCKRENVFSTVDQIV